MSAGAPTSTSAAGARHCSPEQITQYKLRNSGRERPLLHQRGGRDDEPCQASRPLEQTLDATWCVFTHHYLCAKNQQPVAWDGAAHQRLRGEVAARRDQAA